MKTAYASHSADSRQMLAVWIDRRPSVSKEQDDPDAWTGGVARSDFLAGRLAELAHAPGAHVVWVQNEASQWWCRIEHGRRLATSRSRNAKLKDAQATIPISSEIEEEGRRVGANRKWAKKA